MKRNLLVDAIYELCLDLAIIEKTIAKNGEKEIKHNIRLILEEAIFVENLYNTIFVKAKRLKLLQNKKITNILIELEKIRLQLER